MGRYISLLAVILLAASSQGALLPRQNNAPNVTLKNGSYYGVHSPAYDQDFFLGIPYAQPPLGDLRFNLPASLNTTWKDSKNATDYSPECYGYGGDQWVLGNRISEDCLTVNVVRPSGIEPDTKLPVGVWIHGGYVLLQSEHIYCSRHCLCTPTWLSRLTMTTVVFSWGEIQTPGTI
jgi:hypothetical protein